MMDNQSHPRITAGYSLTMDCARDDHVHCQGTITAGYQGPARRCDCQCHRPRIMVMPPLEPPMAMQLSQTEQDYQDMLRLRSYQLALQRGHIRR